MKFPTFILLSLPSSVCAWVLNPFHKAVLKDRAKEGFSFRSPYKGSIILKAGPFFGPEEEFECGEEEECEIDWSLMPGGEEGEVENPFAPSEDESDDSAE